MVRTISQEVEIMPVSKVRHDLMHIIAPPLTDARVVEECYVELERRFSDISKGGLIFPVCQNGERLSDRLSYIENSLRTNGIALSDKNSTIYFTCNNMSYPLGTTEASYCRLSLGIKRESVFIANFDWLNLIADICEKFRAYWGVFNSGDDYYQLNEILQRDRFLNIANLCTSDEKETADRIRAFLFKYKELDRLPHLDIFGYIYKVNDLRIVPEIGWINYWSHSICKYNEIYNIPLIDCCDANGFFANSGACAWSLSIEPWKIDKKQHRDCIINAYNYFSKVGLRT